MTETDRAVLNVLRIIRLVAQYDIANVCESGGGVVLRHGVAGIEDPVVGKTALREGERGLLEFGGGMDWRWRW